MITIIYLGLVLVSVLLTVQSAHVLYLMLYTWDRTDAERKARAPDRFVRPRLSFSVLLPARHEEDVIQTTIDRVVRADYPAELLEVFVICSQDDTGTIKKAEE
ncbi:glycosyltransferase family 2 protein, partial [Streptomyces sp. MCAF7]